MYNLISCTTGKEIKKIKQKVLSKFLDAIVNKLFCSSECNKYEIKFLLLEWQKKKKGKKNQIGSRGLFYLFCFSMEEHKSINAIIRLQKIWVTYWNP